MAQGATTQSKQGQGHAKNLTESMIDAVIDRHTSECWLKAHF